ncbi:MAG: hypothetical protein KDD43_00975 [Bdellovibrionales bacterium]|nr:hypothetical protein [Bdellovibrionales bacterium]
MNAKKGKDIATSMILDDLLDDEETAEPPHQEKRSSADDVESGGIESSGGSIQLDDSSSPFFSPDGSSADGGPSGLSIRDVGSSENDGGIKGFFDSGLKPSNDETLPPKGGKSSSRSVGGGDHTTTKATDQTLRLSESKILPTKDIPLTATGEKATQSSTFVLPERSDQDETKRPGKKSAFGDAVDNVRQSVGRFAAGRGGGMVGPAEASLAQSENLRIAQQRILELEKVIDRLRGENEKLVTAGEMIRKKADELLAKNETMEGRYNLDVSSLTEEKDLLKKSLSAKDTEIEKLKAQLDEMELRLNTTLQKIRVRERELENRLELVKMESSALVRNKDEIILELKRQMDQVSLELDNYRHKGQELNKQLNDKQEMLKRTVKALRIALTMLEGADEGSVKKAK